MQLRKSTLLVLSQKINKEIIEWYNMFKVSMSDTKNDFALLSFCFKAEQDSRLTLDFEHVYAYWADEPGLVQTQQ